MSVSLPQFKNVQLATRDFVPNTYDEGYDANGVVLSSVAEFYNVTKKEKEVLFALDKGFHEAAYDLSTNKISIEDYLQEISKLNQLAKTCPNIVVEMNDKKVFEVSVKSELKPEYQTPEQLRETLASKSKQAILALYGIEWEESERGWGTRPDGFSFHRSEEESEQFLKEFFAKQPKEVPDEYSRPLGKAKLIQVSESLHDYVVANGSVWLAPKDEKAYKTYDASHLNKPKNKM